MNAIIFGANGQDGFYLSKLLAGLGIEVTEIGRFISSIDLKNNNSTIDITNGEQVNELVKKLQPDYIFHFAANSTTNHMAMFENHQTICSGTLNILEAVKCFSSHTKVFISGSGLQFENLGHPIKETDQFEARDPYSVSRIHSVYAARYFRSLDLSIYVGYFFNHDSPRRSERHMAKKISEAVKRISKGSNEKLEIGDIEVIKEWTYAEDVVKGVWRLVNQNNIHEATIGSGLGYSIKDWLDVCFTSIGKDWKNYITLNDNFKAEYKSLVSDPSTLFSLGWSPEISFDELALMMIND
jgi:GDPmannose 4,6-dehydratase